jgi:hypothetical protein
MRLVRRAFKNLQSINTIADIIPPLLGSIHVAWQYQVSVKGENNKLCVVCVARRDTGVTTIFKSESFTFPCQKTQENYEEHGIGIQFNMESGYPSVKIVRFHVRLFVLPALGRKVGQRYFFHFGQHRSCAGPVSSFTLDKVLVTHVLHNSCY